VLLTGAAEAVVLSRKLREYNPALRITVIADKAALAALRRDGLSDARLLSFCSPVIVPGELLAAFPGPSYNFHPGPPERPGRFPSAFAIYERATRFGVTVHEMTEQVDAGPIVTADWFAVSEDIDLHGLEKLTLGCAVALFFRLAPFLAVNPKPLPRFYIPWSGVKRTKAQLDAICAITPDLSETEVALRRRACGPFLKA